MDEKKPEEFSDDYRAGFRDALRVHAQALSACDTPEDIAKLTDERLLQFLDHAIKRRTGWYHRSESNETGFSGAG